MQYIIFYLSTFKMIYKHFYFSNIEKYKIHHFVNVKSAIMKSSVIRNVDVHIILLVPTGMWQRGKMILLSLSEVRKQLLHLSIKFKPTFT